MIDLLIIGSVVAVAAYLLFARRGRSFLRRVFCAGVYLLSGALASVELAEWAVRCGDKQKD